MGVVATGLDGVVVYFVYAEDELKGRLDGQIHRLSGCCIRRCIVDAVPLQ